MWITFPTQSCLVLYSFRANLQHSLIMWLIVSSISPHNLHLLFCCISSIFLKALFCTAIRRDSVCYYYYYYYRLLFYLFCCFVLCSSRKEKRNKNSSMFEAKHCLVCLVIFKMAVMWRRKYRSNDHNHFLSSQAAMAILLENWQKLLPLYHIAIYQPTVFSSRICKQSEPWCGSSARLIDKMKQNKNLFWVTL